MVGHPVAVYPDQALKAVAEERGWRIMDERGRRT
jgi:phosphoserine phosphatase